MEFRKSTKADVLKIMEIIQEAQGHLKKSGINQWQNNYPNNDVIESDILKNESYVLIDNDKIAGTFALSFKDDKSYATIYEGEWLNHGKHSTIHRVAIGESFRGQGLASKIINFATELSINNNVDSIRVDTHKDNIAMQRLLEKNNFKYCGIIYLEDKSPRIAFEKNI